MTDGLRLCGTRFDFRALQLPLNRVCVVNQHIVKAAYVFDVYHRLPTTRETTFKSGVKLFFTQQR